MKKKKILNQHCGPKQNRRERFYNGVIECVFGKLELRH